MVYLDPPYATGQVFKTSDGREAYSDRYTVQDLVTYLQGCIFALQKVMTESTVLFIHLDYRAVHNVKCMLDEVLGEKAFDGEIIWKTGNGPKGNRLSVTHQTILRYAKNDASKLAFYYDDPLLREPYSETSLQMHFKPDKDGRLCRERIVNGKTYTYFADQGRKIGSVWTDVPSMAANSPIQKETTGYPTQKPLKLLKRLILSSTKLGQVVADFMCGSGSTLVAAAETGRQFIGCDIGQVAIDCAAKRLTDLGINFQQG